MTSPSDFRIKGADCAAAAEWEPVDNADGYVLSYYLASEPSKCIKTRYSQKCRKTILGFKNGTEYLADVYAYRTENGREIRGERSNRLSFVPISNKLKTPNVICLEKGSSAIIEAEYKNTVPKVKLSSSDSSIASVEKDGTVTAVSEGTAEITAEMENGEKSVTKIVCGRRLERKKDSSAVIMMTGDLMCAVNHQRKAEKYSFDFSRSFDRIRGLLRKADLAVGVLETTCCDNSVFECEQLRTPAGSPNCNSPSTFVSALRYGGFRALITANNHNCDSGAGGLYETVSLIERHGMKNIGTLERNPVIFELNGIRVAVIALCMIMNGLEESSGLGMENLGRYSPELFEQLCRKARDEGAEFIIAYQHWGKMNSSAVRDVQKTAAVYMADCGADLIVGSHPHVMQKYTVITAADGRKVPCAYSLGNFLTSMSEFDENRLSAVMCCRLCRTESGVSASVSFIPTISADTEYGISVEYADEKQTENISAVLTPSASIIKNAFRPRVMLSGSVVLKKIFGLLSECTVCGDALIISQISILSGSGTSSCGYNSLPARVAMDIEKSFESYIASCGAEYAAVDFYSAAGISCLKRDGSLYTNSEAFRSSGFYKEAPESFERITPPFEKSLWQSAVKKYANALLKVFPKEKIILLRLQFSDTAVKHGEVRNGSDRKALNRRIREMEDFFISLVNPDVIDIAGDYFADGEKASPSAFEPLFYADAADKFKEIIFGNSSAFYLTKCNPEYRMRRAVMYYDNLSARAYMGRMFDSEKAADAIIMYSSKAFAAENSVSLIRLMKNDVRGLLNAAEFLKNDISAEELVKAALAIDAVLKNDLSKPYDFYSVLFRRKMNILKLMAKQLSQMTGKKIDKDSAEIVFLLKDDPDGLNKYITGGLISNKFFVDIWGSCVSREAVNRNNKIAVDKYIFKQMQLLAFEKPCGYSVPKDTVYFCNNSWRRRTIADSFARSGINTLSNSGSEWLIVDFYDLICEAVLFRGQLLEVDDFVKRTDFYKSISSECTSTYLFDHYSEKFCTDNMKRFAEFVKKRYGSNVILIKIDLKDSYISLEDRLEKLNDNDGRLSDRRKFVDFCEKLFAELTECYVIDIARCFYASDRFPLGGAHIVHYEDKFYSETCRIIAEILGGSQQKYYGSIDDNELMLRNLLLDR